jgi:hypothetical protein
VQNAAPKYDSRLKQAIAALLGKVWIDQRGKRNVIGLNDILVVSPYNMQSTICATFCRRTRGSELSISFKGRRRRPF